MFNLRREQLKIFEDAAARELEAKLVARLRSEQPGDCESFNDEALAGFVRYGVDRARVYQFTSEPEIARYIKVMLILGKDFDRDPSYPWAARTLTDPNLGSAAAKLDRLSAAALSAVAGKNS